MVYPRSVYGCCGDDNFQHWQHCSLIVRLYDAEYVDYCCELYTVRYIQQCIHTYIEQTLEKLKYS